MITSLFYQGTCYIARRGEQYLPLFYYMLFSKLCSLLSSIMVHVMLQGVSRGSTSVIMTYMYM